MTITNLLSALFMASISPVAVGEPDASGRELAGRRCVNRCSCVAGGGTREALRTASIVAHGTVLSIRSETTPSHRRIVSIEIRTQWKPSAALDTLEVETGFGGGDCGYTFTVGRAYLVYAYQPDEAGRPVTGICSRTKLYTEAANDVKDLGRPIKRAAK